MRKGTLYFFSRTSPEELDFDTPVATGAIKGTEVVIRVDETGASTFVVLEGEAEVAATATPGLAATQLSSGEQAEVQLDGSVTRTAVLDAIAPVQWALYYPAVLDPAAAEPAGGSIWRDAWLAYRRGALPTAIQVMPAGSAPSTEAERLLAAALALASGKHELNAIGTLSNEPARALRALSAVVTQGPNVAAVQNFVPESATGWLRFLMRANPRAICRRPRRRPDCHEPRARSWVRVGPRWRA